VYVKTKENSDTWKKNTEHIGLWTFLPSKELRDSINKDSSYVNNDKIVSYYNIKYISEDITAESYAVALGGSIYDKIPKKYTITTENYYGWYINSTDKYNLSLSEYRVQFIPADGEIVYTSRSGELIVEDEIKFIENRAKSMADSIRKVQYQISKEKLIKEMGDCSI
jgi:hypothetical protein